MDFLRRLKRLSRAITDRRRLLERRLAEAEQTCAALVQRQQEIELCLDGKELAGLSMQHFGLRRLVRITADVVAARDNADLLKRALLQEARRENLVLEKLRTHRLSLDRQELEREALEASAGRPQIPARQ